MKKIICLLSVLGLGISGYCGDLVQYQTSTQGWSLIEIYDPDGSGMRNLLAECTSVMPEYEEIIRSVILRAAAQTPPAEDWQHNVVIWLVPEPDGTYSGFALYPDGHMIHFKGLIM